LFRLLRGAVAALASGLARRGRHQQG